jgi:hypothetical protein
LSEAERFGHKKIVEFLQWWVAGREESGETLTARGGEALLQQLSEAKLAA